MESVESIRPLAAVLVSTLAAFIILGLRDKPNLRDSVSVVAALVKFSIVASMAPLVLGGGTYELTLFPILPGIDIAFRVDSLGMVFATISSLLWIFAAIYSIGYMRSLNEHAQTRFFACFAVSLSAAVGGAFAANLFTLVIFYEVLSLVTYPLVYHHEDKAAWEGSKKYVIYLVGMSKTFLLAGLALTYQMAGTLDFAPDGLFNSVDAEPLLMIVVYVCYIAGFAKAGIMPLHIWLPSAMVAPTPVSALLHAVAVVKTGVFSTLRVFLFVFGADTMRQVGADQLALVVASVTILTASLLALGQDNLKARLAFSTVSQLSYIVLGAALLNASGVMGGAAHITNHAVSKITLFMCAGSIYASSHKTEISQMSGIARRMPWTMAAFALASLSIVGIPLTSVFVYKWNIALGTVDGHSVVLLGVLLLSSLLSAAYLGPVVYKAYFEEPSPADEGIREVPWMVAPLVISAAMSLLLGIFPGFVLELAGRAMP